MAWYSKSLIMNILLSLSERWKIGLWLYLAVIFITYYILIIHEKTTLLSCLIYSSKGYVSILTINHLCFYLQITQLSVSQWKSTVYRESSIALTLLSKCQCYDWIILCQCYNWIIRFILFIMATVNPVCHQWKSIIMHLLSADYFLQPWGTNLAW